MTNVSALADVINEFVSTERSYVKRLYSLKHDYADPLRTFSRSKDTAIIPPYEAKTLFGNIDQILPVNQAFLEDLELMMLPDGPETVGGIGDVALKHFKQLKGFENYKGYYAKREEAQAIFEKEMKRGSGFSAFIDVSRVSLIVRLINPNDFISHSTFTSCPTKPRLANKILVNRYQEPRWPT